MWGGGWCCVRFLFFLCDCLRRRSGSQWWCGRAVCFFDEAVVGVVDGEQKKRTVIKICTATARI